MYDFAITLHVRKVTIELQTAWARLVKLHNCYLCSQLICLWSKGDGFLESYFKWSKAQNIFEVHGFHGETSMGPSYFPFSILQTIKNPSGWILISSQAKLKQFLWQLICICRHYSHSKWKVQQCCNPPMIPVSEEGKHAVMTCWTTFNFYDFLVISRHYLSGDGSEFFTSYQIRLISLHKDLRN